LSALHAGRGGLLRLPASVKIAPLRGLCEFGVGAGCWRQPAPTPNSVPLAWRSMIRAGPQQCPGWRALKRAPLDGSPVSGLGRP